MIRVSASAFDVLWSDLGHGVPPRPLDVRGVGSTHEDRDEIRRTVYTNLAERGLCAAGEIDPALRDRLGVLATGSVSIECEILPDLSEAGPVRAVATLSGRRGVLAVQPRRTIALSAVRESEIVHVVAGVVPEVEAGPGTGLSLPESSLGAVEQDPRNVSSRRARVLQQQAHEVSVLRSRPVLGAGQFSVWVTDRAGARRLGGVSWFRTDAGAYLGTVTEGRSAERWLSVVPADRAKLAARLTDLLDAVD